MNAIKLPSIFSIRPTGYEIVDIGSVDARQMRANGPQMFCRQRPGRIVIVSNQKVFSLYGDVSSGKLCQARDLHVFALSYQDGERSKAFSTFAVDAQILIRIAAFRGPMRSSLSAEALLAIWRVLRLRYISAASAFLQIPTTLLAMIDSSVGGKTGVNSGVRQESDRRVSSAKRRADRHIDAKNAARNAK